MFASFCIGVANPGHAGQGTGPRPASPRPSLARPGPAAAATAASDFERGRWIGHFAGTFLSEAWDYNLSREVLVGGFAGPAYFVRDGWSLGFEGTLLRVRQEEAADAFLRGLSGILRWHGARGGRAGFFVEAGFGASYASTAVPRRGTRFNYLIQAGGGVTRQVGTRVHLLAGLRWFHLSNNSLAGRDRNPDIEALGGQIGVIVPF